MNTASHLIRRETEACAPAVGLTKNYRLNVVEFNELLEPLILRLCSSLCLSEELLSALRVAECNEAAARY